MAEDGPESEDARLAYSWDFIQAAWLWRLRACDPTDFSISQSMRLVLFVYLSLCAFHVAPAAALTLSGEEWRVFSCTLAKARGQGNPDDAASYALDACATEGMSDAQKEQIRQLVIRRLMKEYGME